VVGFCYYAGDGGVVKDYAEAVRLYRLAAAQGHAYAQYHLGHMFEIGQGVAQDRAEAIRWFRLAAAQGNAIAQERLAAFADADESINLSINLCLLESRSRQAKRAKHSPNLASKSSVNSGPAS
jgi:TPR repeat protein